ncbi:MAG TPA: AAA family ATPase [Verrucomicrobiae bacterium]|jgi:putative DNA primase/helicase|nr:AAA family ATPase [Verrucomicrobiae bacterium]
MAANPTPIAPIPIVREANPAPATAATLQITPSELAKIREQAKEVIDWIWQGARASATNSSNSSEPIKLIRGSEMEPEEITWLWENRIPFGKLTLFAGDPWLGKSTMGVYLAAAISTGQKLYGSPAYIPPAEVLIFSTEDDPEDTILPRFMAAGGIRHNLLTEQMESGPGGPMRLDRDIQRIREMLAKYPKIRLLIIDPVSNYLGDTKMNDEQAVRRLLIPLTRLMKQTGIAVVGIMHLNKKDDLQAMYRVGGAGAFVGVSRAVYGFCQDNVPGEFQMFTLKKNVGQPMPDLKYKIDLKPVEIKGKAVPQPVISWLGEMETSNNGFATPRYGTSAATATKSDEAAEWLKNVLSNGPMRTTEVQDAAKVARFSERTLERAKQKLDVQSDKKADGWYWELTRSEPNQGRQTSESEGGWRCWHP